MYDSPRRQRGLQSVVGAHARQVPAGAHQGTYKDFLRRHELEATAAAYGSKQQRRTFANHLLQRTADSRNLRSAIAYLAAKGEKSPGPDGVRLELLSDHECWQLCRELHRVVSRGLYRVGPSRRLWVPKSSGNGVRPIDILSAADKVVQRAYVQAVQPFLDPNFNERSLGFRPGRGREHALVAAEHLARSANAWTWIAEDLKDAFTQPPRERLYQALRQLELSRSMINLTRNVLGEGQSRGLPQGGPISAFLLNCSLDRYLDRPWERRFPDTPLIRVADDLLVLTAAPEAQNHYAAMADLTRSAGMPLKGTPSQAIVHLDRGEQAEWLGYRVGRSGDSLTCRIGTKAWDKVRTNLILDHLTATPSNSAVATVLGWVDQLGPCFPWEDVSQVYARTISVAAELGFEEMPVEAEFSRHWQRAYARFTSLRALLLRTECFGGGSANRHRETAATSGWGLGVPIAGAPGPSFSSLPTVQLFTDGCCLRQGDAGGWAFILIGPQQGRSEIRSGGETRTTNNRMELAGVINGLERIGEPSRVHLFIDSKYAHSGITKYLAIWRNRRWRCLGGGMVANIDLWQRLATLLERHDVRSQWVRGHSGQPENERCDRESRAAAMQVLGGGPTTDRCD